MPRKEGILINNPDWRFWAAVFVLGLISLASLKGIYQAKGKFKWFRKVLFFLPLVVAIILGYIILNPYIYFGAG